MPDYTPPASGGSSDPALGGDASGTASAAVVTQARGLKSATTTVSVSAATAPSSNQVLTATDSTHATWQPAQGGAPTGTAGGSLAGTYPNPTVAAGAITTTEIAATTIVNANVSASAAIAYSKLALGTSIVNADIAAGAAIAKSKLASLAIADADVSSTAAINTTKILDAPGFAAPGPDIQGYLAWSNDAHGCTTNTAALASGVLATVMVPWPYTNKAIANVDFCIGAGATGATAGQCFVAIYGPAGGAALGSVAAETQFAASNKQTAAISIAAGSLPSTGASAVIYVAFLFNGTTGPTLARWANGVPNALIDAQNRASSSPRYGTFGTAQTAVPSLTVASIAAGHIALSIWCGVR